jgi:F0F1-type ATP synthase alpha subunit
MNTINKPIENQTFKKIGVVMSVADGIVSFFGMSNAAYLKWCRFVQVTLWFLV